mgnify:CR=1 FL=1|jgi:hypothetical protein|tara:strand:+ start:490 stop:738 length:249 start_codon:yes stop_codon:yes gene_type:complete
MKIKHMNVEVIYGNIIHNDGTIVKRTITTYETMQELRQGWKESLQLNTIREANLKELTIELRQYVPAEEYFDVYDMSQEEEE